MGDPCGFEYVWGGLPEKRAQFFLGGCDFHRNYGIVVILLSFLCNYDNFDTKVTSKKNAATMMKDKFLFADSKLEVYQEWVLLLKHLKKVSKSIRSMM